MTHAQALPPPLTPPDCDLTSMPSMLLDVRRLRDSGVAAHENAEVFRASMFLWCAAWHEVPAASLKDDDAELAQKAGFGRFLSEWRKVKDEVLKGFTRCSDGRLYHPVVAEKALEQWVEILLRRVSGARGNESQGKGAGDAGQHMLALGSAALMLHALNPLAKVLKKPLVAEALAMSRADAVRDAVRDGERTLRVIQTDAPRGESLRDAHAPPDAPGTQPGRNGDAPRTQIESNRIISPQPPLEGGVRDALFERIWSIWPDMGRAPTNQDQAKAALDEPVRVIGAEALVARVREFAQSDYAKADGGKRVPSLQKWLRQGRWRNVGDGEPQAMAGTWGGPSELRREIVEYVDAKPGMKGQGEAFARSWLDRVTTWSDVPPAIVCKAGRVDRKLNSTIGKLLRDKGVQLILTQTEAVA